MRSIIRNMINRRGYTIDQTILVVAIIAILITLIIVTLGWTLLSRTAGSKLGTFTDQIDNAVTAFYGNSRVFPGSGVAPATTNLMSDISTSIKFRNAGGSYFHDVGGATGTVTAAITAITAAQAAALNVSGGRAGNYVVVTFTEVPPAELAEADRGIDGQAGQNTGKFIYGASGTTCATLIATPSNTPPSAAGVGCYIATRTS